MTISRGAESSQVPTARARWRGIHQHVYIFQIQFMYLHSRNAITSQLTPSLGTSTSIPLQSASHSPLR